MLARMLVQHRGRPSWVRPEIVLRAASGQPNYAIAKELEISRNTVKHWRFRFARERLAGLKTRPIPGRPRRLKVEAAELPSEGMDGARPS